jgi:hypothetical protein
MVTCLGFELSVPESVDGPILSLEHTNIFVSSWNYSWPMSLV